MAIPADVLKKPLLIVFIAIISTQGFGQEKKDSAATITDDLNKASQQKKEWNFFDTRFTTIRIGGGFLYDVVTHLQDKISKEQVLCEPAHKTRDTRLTLNGNFKTQREFSWRFGYMYDGVSDQWFVRESGLMIGVPELSGKFFIGRTKESFSMNKVMVGYAGWTMERQVGIDVIPILADGIKYLGYYPKHKLFLNLGAFANWTSKNQSFSTFEWQVVSRFGCLPVYSESKKRVLHLALNLRYGKPEDGQIRLRSRPESNASPYFMDTGLFPAEHSFHYGLEAYYSSGAWMLGGEYSAHQFDSPLSGDPLFHGGELMIGYILTGESRPYSTTTAIYGFVPVKRSVFKGGPGAIEFVTRITNQELNSGQISGGNFWRWTPTLNWYLSTHIRLELVYGYGVLNRFSKTGHTQFFQSRLQLTL